MAKGSLNFFEMHVEKIVLGLSGLFALGVVGWYVVSSPNRIEYGGEKVGPRELEEKILSDAQQLDQAVRSAKPKEAPVVHYSQNIDRELAAGIAVVDPAEEGPPINTSTRLAAAFRDPLPKLDEDEGKTVKVALVKPLQPDEPVARTGRSMAYRKQLAASPALVNAATNEERLEETTWITVGALYDTAAQQKAMQDAGYGSLFAKVFVAGIDLQRQELQPSGEWSDWKDVQPNKATPILDVPTPALDDRTGDLTNREAIDRAQNEVRGAQPLIMEPPFYLTRDGDQWKPPPFDQIVPPDENESVDAAPAPKQPKEPKQPKQPHNPPPHNPPHNPPPFGPSGAGGGGKGGGIMAPTGGGGRARPVQTDKAEAKKRAAEDLKEAKAALKAREYDKAKEHAEAVNNNEEASKSQKDEANRIIEDCEKEQPKAPNNPSMPTIQGKGGGPPTPIGQRGSSPAPEPAKTLLTDPQSGATAIWAHDDSVEGGKTYRYRLRVKLWNRYVGRTKLLQNVQDARVALLTGEWSEPTDPVTAAPSVRFYVKGAKLNEPVALVDVFRWREGKWLKESFEARVGDTIGGSKEVKVADGEDGKAVKEKVDFGANAVVLDVRPNETVRYRSSSKPGEISIREGPSVVLVYLDTVDGQVKEKLAVLDKNDPTYKKLKEGEPG